MFKFQEDKTLACNDFNELKLLRNKFHKQKINKQPVPRAKFISQREKSR